MARVFTELRKLRPPRKLSRDEAMCVAEQQALRLLALHRLTSFDDAPVPEELISHLPRIVVRRLELGPTISGLAHWQNGMWCVALNGNEPLVRQRFSLAHELSHILEAPFARYAVDAHTERVADHFAASLLMPRIWVKQLWRSPHQDPRAMAAILEVSEIAMYRRLHALGLHLAADPEPEHWLPESDQLNLDLYGGAHDAVAA